MHEFLQDSYLVAKGGCGESEEDSELGGAG